MKRPLLVGRGRFVCDFASRVSLMRDTLDLLYAVQARQSVLEVLNIGLGVSFRGVEVRRGIGSTFTVEGICPGPTGECVIVATTLQCIVASLAEQLIIPSNTFQGIVTATPAAHIVAALAIDSIVGICAHHHIYSGGAIESAIIDLAIIWSPDNTTLGVDVDGRCLPIATGSRRCSGGCPCRCS